jgi:hypothetical protein
MIGGTQIKLCGNPNSLSAILIPLISFSADKKVLSYWSLEVLVQHFFSAGSFSYTMEHMGAGTNSKKIA